MKYLLILLLLVGCSNPVKPQPYGVCVLVLTHLATGLRMQFDTVVTCADCNKIASYGGYQVESWTEEK